jgi:hypothetical protein
MLINFPDYLNLSNHQLITNLLFLDFIIRLILNFIKTNFRTDHYY